MMSWLNAESTCQQMSISISEPARLLEMNSLNEFYFIQRSIEQILTDEHMKEEMNTSSGILSSAVAFIGSKGQINSKQSKFNRDENS